jgi:hypothetical protein
MKALGGAHLRRLVPCVAQRRQRGNSEGQLEEEKEPEPAVVPDGNPIEFPYVAHWATEM